MNKIIPLALFLAMTFFAAAQNDDSPGWTQNTPKAGNGTYVYVVERGDGISVNDAVNNALLKVLRTTMMRIGAVVSWDEVNNSLQNGSDWGAVSIKYNIPVNKVCEYIEQKTDKGYRVAILCQVAKSGAVYPEFDEFTGCNDTRAYNNGSALLKSALLPGLGQIGKNRTASGALTMLGEVAFVGSGVAAYYMANHQFDIMQNPQTSLENFQIAKQKYNSWRIVNISSLSAAAVLYLWNLYRAYTIKPNYKQRKYVALYPTMIPEPNGVATGVGLTFNF